MIADHSAATHQQYPSAQYDTYSSQPQLQQQYQDSGFNSQPYNNPSLLAAAGMVSHPTDYYSSPPPVQQQRNYSLGGGNYDMDYGANQVPDHTQRNSDQFFPSPYDNPRLNSPPQLSSSPAPINTNVVPMPAGPSNISPVKGPRTMVSPVQQYNDSPPSYEHGPPQPSGAWGEKR